MKLTLTTLALVGVVAAQRPANVSICDYYTTALLKENTAKNQYTLLTLLVNTAVIGNYTKPNVGIQVPGILAPGKYNGTDVNLLPYFDGGLKSTNNGGSSGVAENFLDDGGAAPLLMNMPANGTTSNQFMLLTHLYEYFGALLGCSGEGTGNDFPAYGGEASQYEVHKYMALDEYQLGYFITQVGLAAASFGVATDDVTAVGKALAGLFALRCAPPTVVIPSQGAQLQSICIADSCPLSPNSTCSSYEMVQEPIVANVTLAMGEGVNATSTMNGTSTATGTGSMSSPTITPSSAGVRVVGSLAAAMAAVAAFVL